MKKQISILSVIFILIIAGFIACSGETGTEPDEIIVNNYYTNVNVSTTYVTNLFNYYSNIPSASLYAIYYIPTPPNPTTTNYSGWDYWLVTNKIYSPIGSSFEIWIYRQSWGWTQMPVDLGPYDYLEITENNILFLSYASNFLTNAIVVYY